MRPASVGFQCPSCVREGAKDTRAGRTAYGGQRSGNPALTSQVLIGINVVVWLLLLATGGSRGALFDHLVLRPSGGPTRLNGLTYLVPNGVAQGEYWQLLTSMFSHTQVWHIGFNMLVLYSLGPQLELALGRARFLAVYLISGLAGSATVLWLSTPYVATLGASGAIFGMLGALLVITIKVQGDVRSIATWIAINFAITFVFNSSISWQGHLGGFVGGVLVGAALAYAPRQNRACWQSLGVGAVALLVAVATVLGIAALA